MTRIALIHAVTAAMQPVENSFRAHWNEARRTNLLDDALAPDREQAGWLTPGLSERIVLLAKYAVASGAEGVLFTCSAFGEAIEQAAEGLPTPVLKPNEAMFEAALESGQRIGMLATFAPAVASMEQEFKEMAERRKVSASLETVLVAGAREALNAGDLKKHCGLIANAAAALDSCDAIMLAHFSMGDAAPEVQAASRRPILTAPNSAVLKLRSHLTQPSANLA
jgi:Asp/Glu/Hydantoin racemase